MFHACAIEEEAGAVLARWVHLLTALFHYRLHRCDHLPQTQTFDTL